jgi:hypothetical protein
LNDKGVKGAQYGAMHLCSVDNMFPAGQLRVVGACVISYQILLQWIPAVAHGYSVFG